MIVLVLYNEKDEKTGKATGRKLVSHGIDTSTLKSIILPTELPQTMGWFNEGMQEWILKE